MITTLPCISLSLEDSVAFKDVIQHILFSDLFALCAGRQKYPNLWYIRERTLYILCSMTPASDQSRCRPLSQCHQWPILEDVINSLIRMGLHPNFVEGMSLNPNRMFSQTSIHILIVDHWYASDVDTTYSTLLEVDAFVFFLYTKYLFFESTISIFAAYV